MADYKNRKPKAFKNAGEYGGNYSGSAGSKKGSGKQNGHSHNGKSRNGGNDFSAHDSGRRGDTGFKGRDGAYINRDETKEYGMRDRDGRFGQNAREATEDAGQELCENMLEGRNAVKEAIKAGREIERILISNGPNDGSVREIAAQARKNGVQVQEVERIRLDRLSKTGVHQGIIAFVAAKEYCSVDDILDRAKSKGEDPFIIILDGITDPQNLGSIIRSAECAGAHGVIIPKHRAVGLTPVVAKASAGAIEYMPVAKVTNTAQTIQRLKKQGIWIFGAAMDGEPCVRTNLRGPIGIVIGSEGSGLSQIVRKSCDRIISLPVRGNVDSLNAAVSAAVIMYEAIRQRDTVTEKG